VAHLNFHFEFIGITLDEFTKIDPAFCGIEENRFSTIALNLYVGYLHLKIERKCNGSGSF
jgi:hypothetical protein